MTTSTPRTLILKITVGGRPAITLGQAVDRYRERYGINTRKQMLNEIVRHGVQAIEPPPIDARTPVYYTAELDKMMRERPGKGVNLRKSALR